MSEKRAPRSTGNSEVLVCVILLAVFMLLSVILEYAQTMIQIDSFRQNLRRCMIDQLYEDAQGGLRSLRRGQEMDVRPEKIEEVLKGYDTEDLSILRFNEEGFGGYQVKGTLRMPFYFLGKLAFVGRIPFHEQMDYQNMYVDGN